MSSQMPTPEDDSLPEDLTADLEPNPERSPAYFLSSAVLLTIWLLTPHNSKLDLFPLFSGSAGAVLLLKGFLLRRKPSGGTHPSPKPIPTPLTQLARILQDASVGGAVLCALIRFAEALIAHSSRDPMPSKYLAIIPPFLIAFPVTLLGVILESLAKPNSKST